MPDESTSSSLCAALTAVERPPRGSGEAATEVARSGKRRSSRKASRRFITGHQRRPIDSHERQSVLRTTTLPRPAHGVTVARDARVFRSLSSIALYLALFTALLASSPAHAEPSQATLSTEQQSIVDMWLGLLDGPSLHRGGYASEGPVIREFFDDALRFAPAAPSTDAAELSLLAHLSDRVLKLPEESVARLRSDANLAMILDDYLVRPTGTDELSDTQKLLAASLRAQHGIAGVLNSEELARAGHFKTDRPSKTPWVYKLVTRLPRALGEAARIISPVDLVEVGFAELIGEWASNPDRLRMIEVFATRLRALQESLVTRQQRFLSSEGSSVQRLADSDAARIPNIWEIAVEVAGTESLAAELMLMVGQKKGPLRYAERRQMSREARVALEQAAEVYYLLAALHRQSKQLTGKSALYPRGVKNTGPKYWHYYAAAVLADRLRQRGYSRLEIRATIALIATAYESVSIPKNIALEPRKNLVMLWRQLNDSARDVVRQLFGAGHGLGIAERRARAAERPARTAEEIIASLWEEPAPLRHLRLELAADQRIARDAGKPMAVYRDPLSERLYVGKSGAPHHRAAELIVTAVRRRLGLPTVPAVERDLPVPAGRKQQTLPVVVKPFVRNSGKTLPFNVGKWSELQRRTVLRELVVDYLLANYDVRHDQYLDHDGLPVNRDYDHAMVDKSIRRAFGRPGPLSRFRFMRGQLIAFPTLHNFLLKWYVDGNELDLSPLWEQVARVEQLPQAELESYFRQYAVARWPGRPDRQEQYLRESMARAGNIRQAVGQLIQDLDRERRSPWIRLRHLPVDVYQQVAGRIVINPLVRRLRTTVVRFGRGGSPRSRAASGGRR